MLTSNEHCLHYTRCIMTVYGAPTTAPYQPRLPMPSEMEEDEDNKKDDSVAHEKHGKFTFHHWAMVMRFWLMCR